MGIAPPRARQDDLEAIDSLQQGYPSSLIMLRPITTWALLSKDQAKTGRGSHKGLQ